MWILYQIAMGIALVVAGPFLLIARGTHYLRSVRGRLGRGPETKAAGALWIHGVSVGEIAIAATLARALPDDLPLVVTSITPTGQDLARRTLSDRATVSYFPYELGFAVRRFFRRHRPAALVLAEGDLWPLVLRHARRARIPVVVVNGRVSDTSYRRMARLRPLLGPLLDPVDRFGVQTNEDRRRLIDLGVPAEKVRRTGNLKFESAEPALGPELRSRIEAFAAGRAILLAGSTMDAEETRVLDAFSELPEEGRPLLVIAPRHPERFDDVARLVGERGLTLERRSAQATADRVDVVLLDTLGELAGLYGIATIAFIGGTLVPTGGHNPLEPARFGVPVTAGPSMENFREIAETFDREDAWRRGHDPRALAAIWSGWLQHPEEARRVGEAGRRLVDRNGGALARTLEMLEPTIRAARSSSG